MDASSTFHSDSVMQIADNENVEDLGDDDDSFEHFEREQLLLEIGSKLQSTLASELEPSPSSRIISHFL